LQEEMTSVEHIVEQFIASEGLMPQGGGILLAISGGADSIAMLNIMHVLRSNGAFNGELFVGHVNHQLRGEASDGDEAFVMAHAARLGLKASSVRVDVRGHAASLKLSIETAARHLRHQALAQMACDFGCGTIATAHHKNDNAETLIHRILRGTGYRGLAGIWPRKQFASGITCIRPMLKVSRSQITDYLNTQKLTWRTDASNEDLDHTRNFIRHRLLPQVAGDTEPALLDSLLTLSATCRRYWSSVVLEADSIWATAVRVNDRSVEIDRKAFNYCHPAIKLEILQRALQEIGCGEMAITASHYARIFEMAALPASGRKLSLPNSASVCFDHATLSISLASSSRTGGLAECRLEVPGTTLFGPWRITSRSLVRTPGDIVNFSRSKTPFVEWFDMDVIDGPIIIRSRLRGDKFHPFGSNSERKIGKFLTAARVPRHVRNDLVVLADSTRIIWVCPLRSSDETRVTEKTTSILEISAEKA
jgi:tRNA(Ile)-lysidine synthase